VQLVASLAFPAITRTEPDTPARQHAVGLAFLIAWALACAAIAAVATFSLPIASLLFGWGRMSASGLEVIAQWSTIGIWSLLPQALMAVLLTVMATNGRMRTAVWVTAAGLVVLLLAGWLGRLNGHSVMWLLNAVFVCMAVVLMLLERRSIQGTLPYLACLVPLLVCAGLVSLKPLFSGLSAPFALMFCITYGVLVMGSAALASPVLRAMLRDKFHRTSSAIQP
jgi:putative peptidoglycan lipid II flippase